MLDPHAQLVLDLIKAAGRPPMTALSAQEARAAYRAARGAMTPELPEVALVEDITAPGPGGPIPLRHYRGIGTDPSEKLPCLVYIHGGGWVIGDLDTHDYVCRRLANAAGCSVVSVDYRLSPEHKFPAAVEDCEAAVRFVASEAERLRIDAERLAVGGDSAGGALSAVMAHLARDGVLPPVVMQLLIYPGTDISMSHPSYDRAGLADMPLSGELARWFKAHYLSSEADADDWRASPLRAPRLDGLADAFILTVGYDPLVDEGQEYARKLEAAGVRVSHLHLSDQVHGFITMSKVIRAAETTLDTMALALRRAFV